MNNFICTKCGQEKPSDEFYIYENSRGPGWCKLCRSEDSKAKYAADPDQVRLRNLITRHGMTEEQYEALVTEQDGKCAICRKPETQNKYGQPQRLSTDHDHSCCPGYRSCGKCVRRLLCAKCNFGLGNFNDDPELLEAAATYLRACSTPI